jgi:hypothetical protein
MKTADIPKNTYKNSAPYIKYPQIPEGIGFDVMNELSKKVNVKKAYKETSDNANNMHA